MHKTIIPYEKLLDVAGRASAGNLVAVAVAVAGTSAHSADDQSYADGAFGAFGTFGAPSVLAPSQQLVVRQTLIDVVVV